jgi:hypothetical protein
LKRGGGSTGASNRAEDGWGDEAGGAEQIRWRRAGGEWRRFRAEDDEDGAGGAGPTSTEQGGADPARIGRGSGANQADLSRGELREEGV